MALELFTVATQQTAGLARLQGSLAKFSVPITLLGQDETEYWGHGWRWKTFIRATKTSSADVVMHCDGYDTVCLESMAGIGAKFQSLGHPLVFAYEPQVQPEFWLGLQPGLMIAQRTTLVFNDATLDALFPDHFNDMYQIQSMYSWNPSAFKVDQEGVLFHTISQRGPELTVRNNRLVNSVTGNSPSFVHAPNHGDLSRVEQWLAAAPG